MIISVRDDAGERYSYDTDKTANCLFPARVEIAAIAAALREALEFLEGEPTSVVTRTPSGRES